MKTKARPEPSAFGEAWELLFDPPVAHRGLWSPGGAPENSLAAFQAACAAGYGIELDVQITADGEAVVFHDYKLDRLTEAWTGYTTLVTTIPALDPAAETADSSVHYLGPIFEMLPDVAWESPWQADDRRPLVLVSFSTTGLWDQGGRIRNTLEGLAGEPVRVLVSASQDMDLGPIPDNVQIVPYLPHHLQRS